METDVRHHQKCARAPAYGIIPISYCSLSSLYKPANYPYHTQRYAAAIRRISQDVAQTGADATLLH